MKKLIFGFLAFLVASCSLLPKPDPSLPPETQEGKNTFGCLVNGKVWNANFGTMGDLYGTPLTRAKYDPFREGQFSILASNNAILHFLIVGTPIEGKIYEFSKIKDFQVGNIIIGISSYNACSYIPPDLSYFQGTFHVKKFDLQKRIIAGNFDFMLKNDVCDTIKVSNGRFDMRF